MTTTEPTRQQPTLSERDIKLIIFGLLMAVFLSAVDGTIVSTALPTIVGELGGLDQLTWVVTSYFVTSTVSTLLIGKMSDIYGRRPMFMLSIVAFLLASVLAGLSQSMSQLVAFRALQGVGGGGLQSLAFIVIGDILSPRERGRYMGWFTGTFALSGLIGPLLGGLIVDAGILGWRWIFYLNIPLGIITLAVVGRYLRIPTKRATVRIDWEGAVYLSIGVGSLLVAASIGGDDLAWSSPTILTLAAVGLIFSTLFIRRELRAENPILPLRLFSNDIFRVGMLLSFVSGAALMSANIFLPVFLQVVSGASATVSGLLLAPMMFGLTVASIFAGRRITTTGRYRRLIRIGPIISVIGMIGLATLSVDSQPWNATPFVIINGIGLGLMMPPLSIAIQNGVSFRDLGVATSANTFFRTLGMTFGVATFGAIMAARLRAELANRLPADQVADLNVAELTGSPETIRQLPAELQGPVITSVAESINLVYLTAVPVAILMAAMAWILREAPLRERSPLEESQAEARSEAATTTPDRTPDETAPSED
ncbi:MAG: MFS transporter [Actinomycetia bacterium]|nr:MFS transporter [Actinomycetes bacterium]